MAGSFRRPHIWQTGSRRSLADLLRQSDRNGARQFRPEPLVGRTDGDCRSNIAALNSGPHEEEFREEEPRKSSSGQSGLDQSHFERLLAATALDQLRMPV